MKCEKKNSSSLISHNRQELLFFFVAGSMAKNLDNFASEKNPFIHKFCLKQKTCSGKREHILTLLKSYKIFSYN